MCVCVGGGGVRYETPAGMCVWGWYEGTQVGIKNHRNRETGRGRGREGGREGRECARGGRRGGREGGRERERESARMCAPSARRGGGGGETLDRRALRPKPYTPYLSDLDVST